MFKTTNTATKTRQRGQLSAGFVAILVMAGVSAMALTFVPASQLRLSGKKPVVHHGVAASDEVKNVDGPDDLAFLIAQSFHSRD